MSETREHGYGMRPDGWGPGYCWCGEWATLSKLRPEETGCAGLASIFGRTPEGHRDAMEMARLHGMDWDPFADPAGGVTS